MKKFITKDHWLPEYDSDFSIKAPSFSKVVDIDIISDYGSIEFSIVLEIDTEYEYKYSEEKTFFFHIEKYKDFELIRQEDYIYLKTITVSNSKIKTPFNNGNSITLDLFEDKKIYRIFMLEEKSI
jgi:hypothetical protein